MISLESSEPIIGLNSAYQYTSKSLILPSSAYIVAFTDGLHENSDKFSASDEFIKNKLSEMSFQSTEFQTQLWQKCLPDLTKEIDDSTLLVLNKV